MGTRRSTAAPPVTAVEVGNRSPPVADKAAVSFLETGKSAVDSQLKFALDKLNGKNYAKAVNETGNLTTPKTDHMTEVMSVLVRKKKERDAQELADVLKTVPNDQTARIAANIEKLLIKKSNALKADDFTEVVKLKKQIAALAAKLADATREATVNPSLPAASPTAPAEETGEQAQANELMSFEKKEDAKQDAKQDAMQKEVVAMQVQNQQAIRAMEERTEKAEEDNNRFRADYARREVEIGENQVRNQERADAKLERVNEDEAKSQKKIMVDEAERDRRQQATDKQNDLNR